MSSPQSSMLTESIRQQVRDNVAALRDRIDAAAERGGRRPEQVRMIAVSKWVGVEETALLHESGVEHLAENRIEKAEPKIAALPDTIRWHMVGNVQRRKARAIVESFPMIDAVDRMKLAAALQQRCEELDVAREILLEVNVSGEEQKHGFSPESLGETLAELNGLERLRTRGLMTMAPRDADEAELRRVFGGLRRLAEEHELTDLSMGMSDDFEIAIEEGATEVRIGRAFFAGTGLLD